jgi:hypothetical protein
MRITRPFASALAVISVGVLFIAAQPAKADFIWTFNQTGTNTVVVTGSGSFNTNALGAPTPDGPFDFVNGLFSGDTFAAGQLNNEMFNVWRSGNFQVLSGSSFFFSANLATNGPTDGDFVEMFHVGGSEGPVLSLNANYFSGAPISNTTTLNGVSLTDFGFSTAGTLANPVLQGTWTLHNPDTGVDTGDTITIYSVPEPSQMMLLAGAGLTVGAWRMRKLRRKSVASTAIAC